MTEPAADRGHHRDDSRDHCRDHSRDRHRGTAALQRMLEFAPATGGLALWVGHKDVAAGGPPPLFTDGHTLHYNPAFETIPLAEQVGWVAHEVLHIALRHVQRYRELQGLLGDVDLPLFNLCADAIVNSSLVDLAWLQLPAGGVTLDRLLATALGQTQGVEAALLEWDVERLYRAIDDRRPVAGSSSSDAGRQPARAAAATPREDGPRAARARALAATTAADLRPDSTAPPAEDAPETQAERAREWRERLLRAHAGDGAFSLLRMLGADLPSTRTPWEQALRTLLACGLSTRPGLSWSRPARSYIANQGRAGAHRLPWEPGVTAARRAPRLVVVLDVSGSIDAELLDRFAGEVEAITRRLEAGLVLVVGDDRVRQVLQHEPGRSRSARFDWRQVAFKGGGGTDFTPLLEEADRHRPDIGVVLTDLEGPARFQPRWPVVWAVPESAVKPRPPFGRLLTLR